MTEPQDDLDAASQRLAAAEEKLDQFRATEPLPPNADAPAWDEEKREAHRTARKEWEAANREVERLKAEFEHRD